MFSTVKIKLAPVAARNDGMQRIDDRKGPLESRADDAQLAMASAEFHSTTPQVVTELGKRLIVIQTAVFEICFPN